MKQPLCLTCEHLETEEVEGHYEKSVSGYNVWIPIYIYYSCKKTLANIHTFRKYCRHYSPYTQTKLNIGEDRMVKIGQIPDEGKRLKLDSLPDKVVLIVVGESWKEGTSGKSGGLVLSFRTKKGETFEQKYGKQHGHILAEALKKLGYDGTEPLASEYHNYELTDMPMGFSRMIPVSKAKTE